MEKLIVPSWDDYFMTMAYFVAMKSKDTSSHIGAVIVGPKKEIRSTGYNGLPRGVNDNVPERQEKPEKYFWFEHAERNAIYNATLMGSSLKECKMYTNGMPCADCARGVIQSGIIEVIVDEAWDRESSEKWADSAKRSIQMFDEAGVKYRPWTGKLVEIFKFRRGEKFT